MLLKDLCIPKNKLTTVTEEATLKEAIQTLEESGYRCIPVLSQDGKKFCGNIYKMHIYRHISRGGSLEEPVTSLIKNASKHINLESSFFKVFFTIKELPYIAVLKDNGNFYGILTHASMLSVLEESWNVDTGSYVLTIALPEIRGSIAKTAKIISKYSNIASIISLDSKDKDYVRRVLITLPDEADEKQKNQIVGALEENGLRVISVESLRES